MYKIINHDDTIPEKQLENYVEDTDKAWKKRNDRRKEAEEELRNWKPLQPTKLELEPELAAEEVKPTGIKSKIRSILKIKKKARVLQPFPPIPAAFLFLLSTAPPYARNGYLDKQRMFAMIFNEGLYELEEEDSPTTAESSENGKDEKSLSMFNGAEGDKENIPTKLDDDVNSDEDAVHLKALEGLKITSELPSLENIIPEKDKVKAFEGNGADAVKLDKNEIIYDRENISYHDKSELNLR